MKNLGRTFELNSEGHKITRPASGLYSSPAEDSAMGLIVLDLSSLMYQPKSRERSVRPTKHVTLAISWRKSTYPAHHNNWMTTKITNFLCNLHPKKKRWSVNPPQYAEFLHLYEKEKDLQSGEIRLPHWNNMCQKLRVSVQKKSRVWAENQTALSGKLPTSCRMFATWRTFTWSITTCLLHSSRRERLTWTFLERCMTFTSMWWRHVNFAFRRNRDQIDHAWVDRAEEFGDLIFLDHGSANIGDHTFGFLFVLDGATSHWTAYPCNSTSPSQTFPSFVSGWILSRWIRRRFVQTWLSIILMICRHSIECTIFRDSYWTAHSLAKSSWDGCPIVSKIPLGTRRHSLQKFGQDYSVTNHTCSVDAQGSDGEKHTGNSELQNACGVAMGRRPRYLMDPASMNPEQLTSTPYQTGLFFMRKFKKFNWLRRHISKSNNEKTFDGILLKEWNLFLPV